MSFGSRLPPEWCWASVGDVAVVTGGITKNPARRGLPLQVPYLRVANVYANALRLEDVGEIGVKKGELERALLKPGDLLIVEGNGSIEQIGRVARWTGAIDPCVHQNHLIKLRFNEEFLGPWSLYWLLSPSGREQVTRVASSTSGLFTLSLSKVRGLSTPICGAKEQRRIVEAIESYLTRLDAAVAALERVQRNLKRYRASVLKAAVEGQLVPTEAELARKEGREYEPASVLLERILEERRRRWIEDAADKARAKAEDKARKAGKPWPAEDDVKTLEQERAKAAKKHKEAAAPDTEGLPELPEGWCWATVEQITSGDRKCAYGVLVPGPDTPGGVPLVRVGDMVGGRVATAGMKRIARSVADKFSKTYLRGGEVLMSLVGTIGRTAVAPESLAGANVARAVGVLPVAPGADPHWVEVWFRSPEQRHLMTEKAHEVARKTLNLEDVRSAPVALAPMGEQARICSIIEDVEWVVRATEEAAGRSTIRCQRLRQSILKWAFEGKLVDQDPNDEPASVLLERIKAEREMAEQATRPRERAGTRRIREPRKKPERAERAVDEARSATQVSLPIEDANEGAGSQEPLSEVLHYLQTHPGPSSKAQITELNPWAQQNWNFIREQLATHPKVRISGRKRGTRYAWRSEP